MRGHLKSMAIGIAMVAASFLPVIDVPVDGYTAIGLGQATLQVCMGLLGFTLTILALWNIGARLVHRYLNNGPDSFKIP